MAGGRTRFWAQVGAAALVFLAGIALAAVQVGWWAPPGGAQVALVAVGLAVAFAATVKAALDEHRGARAEALREDVRAVLFPLLLDLQSSTGIGVRQLGVAAYRLRTPLRPRGRDTLERLLRLRPLNQGTSGVRWRPGVGIVGQCVQRGEDIVEDVAALDEQLGGLDRAAWSALGTDLTYGFTFAEYQRVRGKYGVVLATPIIADSPEGSKVIGCVSVDAPAGTLDLLAAEEVRGAAAAAADMIVGLVRR